MAREVRFVKARNAADFGKPRSFVHAEPSPLGIHQETFFIQEGWIAGIGERSDAVANDGYARQ
jgi:hypothetical protein